MQRLTVGTTGNIPFLDNPHEPLAAFVALQLAATPPFDPLQVHVQGPVPVTVEAVPIEQRLVVGIDVLLVPFEIPQTPLIIKLALQLADDPPFDPLQVQAQGPVPVTAEAVPVEQRLAIGADDKLELFDAPHTPSIGAALHEAEQLADDPPFDPPQVHETEPP